MASTGVNTGISAASGAVSGAVAGTAIMPVLGTIAGAVIGGAASGLGANASGNATTKAANFANDIKVNIGHLANYWKNLWNGAGGEGEAFYQYTKSGVITAADEPYLATLFNSTLASKVQADPYLGGLGSSYTSKYTGANVATVPAVGVMQEIDAYIAQREATKKTPGTALAYDNANLSAQTQLLQDLKNAVYGLVPQDNTQWLMYGAIAVLAVLLLSRRK